jgi:hypothetical protein
MARAADQGNRAQGTLHLAPNVRRCGEMTDLLADLVRETPAKRWLRKYLDHQDKEFCLIWPFRRAQNGYAQVGAARVVPTRVMCEYRNGPAPTPEHQAAHSCGNGHNGCVNPWHLNWRTRSENQFERYQHQGRRMPRYRLRPEQVDEIRSMKGRERTVDTAARFQCSEANVRQIQSGKTWRQDRTDFHHFTREEVIRIKNEPPGRGVVPALAKEFGVTTSTIYRIRNAQSYLHFDDATTARSSQQTSQQRAPGE